MAFQNYDLPFDSFTYVDLAYRDTNYHGSAYGYVSKKAYTDHNTGRIQVDFRQTLMHAAGMPSAAGKLISNFHVYASIEWSSGELIDAADGGVIAIGVLDAAWDENTVTMRTRPDYAYLSSLNVQPGSVSKEQYDKIRQYGVLLYPKGYSVEPGTQWAYPISSAADPDYFPHIRFTLSDSVPIGTPVRPARIYVEANVEQTFAWNFANAVGGAQGAYILQISSDGETWTELASGTTGETSTTVPSGTLHQDHRYWRVRVTSEYGIDSDWSDPVEIVVIDAPACAIESIVNTPRPAVTWSSDAQQAYQVQMGGFDSGVIYGTIKTYKCPEYLPDGETMISVRTQSNLGLWSQWSEQMIAIANVPGSDITLSVFPTHRARLSWTNHEKVCYVLRDGAPVTKTKDAGYTDEFVLGKHTYQILEALENDNYTLSNRSTVTLRADHAMITAVETIAWVPLTGSLERHPSIKESSEKSVTLVHYAGRTLPVVETDGFVDKTMSFTVAFRTPEECEKFETFLGKMVCYKSYRYDNL